MTWGSGPDLDYLIQFVDDYICDNLCFVNKWVKEALGLGNHLDCRPVSIKHILEYLS